MNIKEEIVPDVPPLGKEKFRQFQSEVLRFNFTDEILRTIRDILFVKEKFDLDSYKDKCIQRRISFRIRTTGCRSPEEYISLLRNSEGEVRNLLGVLTINVTEFFRNRSTFEKLRETVFPDIFSTKKDGEKVRLWSAGCASGEEPYTLAIIMRESFPHELKRVKVTITATDIDEDILRKAEGGIYSGDKIGGIEPALRDRYFIASDGTYRLIDEIRKMVLFVRQDIFHDGQLKNNDLIICRNLLIYFAREKQEWVLNKFYDALNPGGFLVLGKAELLVGESRQLFSTVCPKERIYRKIA